MARIDRLVYFKLEADADTYIAAIIGTGSLGTKILAAGNDTLVVATQPNNNSDDTPGNAHKVGALDGVMTHREVQGQGG